MPMNFVPQTIVSIVLAVVLMLICLVLGIDINAFL